MAESTSKGEEDSDELALYFDFPKFEKIDSDSGSKFKLKEEGGYENLPSGNMYRDIKVGEGEGVKEKLKVSLHYNYYDQDGKLIESMNFEGSLAQLESTDKFGPGLKEGIKDMKLNGKRRIIILSWNKEKGGDSKHKSGVAEPKEKGRDSKDKSGVAEPKEKGEDSKDKSGVAEPKEKGGDSKDKSGVAKPKEKGGDCKDKSGVAEPKEKGGDSKHKSGVSVPKEKGGDSKDRSGVAVPKEKGGDSKHRSGVAVPKEKGGDSKDKSGVAVPKEKRGDSKDKSGVGEPGVFDVELLGIRRTWNPFG